MYFFFFLVNMTLGPTEELMSMCIEYQHECLVIPTLGLHFNLRK